MYLNNWKYTIIKMSQNYPKDIEGHIYMITCIPTSKNYIGQTKNYVWNHGKYRYYSYIKRFNDHISEAINNTKKNQCTKLNNAIRKYGKECFEVKLLHICNIKFLNYFEKLFIHEYDTLNDGYNLTEGGTCCKMTDEIKKKLSNKTKLYFTEISNKEKISEIHWKSNDKKKINELKNIIFDKIIVVKRNSEVKVKCNFYKDNKLVYNFLLSGKHVSYKIALERTLNICNEVYNLPIMVDMKLKDIVFNNNITLEYIEI